MKCLSCIVISRYEQGPRGFFKTALNQLAIYNALDYLLPWNGCIDSSR